MSFLEPGDDNRLEPDYAEPFRQWKAKPDKFTTGQLLKAVEPEIRRGIFAHVGGDNPLLRSRARQLAVKAFGTYNPSRAKLGTHVVNSLQGLTRINRKQTQIISVPERLLYDKSQIDRLSGEMEEELGREPSLQELADKTGFSPRRITRARSVPATINESMFNRGNPAEGHDANVMAVNQRQTTAWAEVLYHDMDHTNQKIMEWSLGIGGSQLLSNKEIARRLRISPGAVTQRKQRIQQMLDSMHQLGGQY